jgi:D-serine dehydratase
MQRRAFSLDSFIEKLARAEETAWINPSLKAAGAALGALGLTMEDMLGAQRRLERFAPFIASAFPETAAAGGLIESPLTEIPSMQSRLASRCGADIDGRLFLKRDCDLPIAGSVKARGGIYEILKHTEELAVQAGILNGGSDYAALDTDAAREFFSRYTVQVSSTGNLGLSIGIMSAKIGYKVIVHMSADARQWKKDLLRSKGVEVIEYAADYSRAVIEGRKRSDMDPMSYFVDDENSVSLFLGYSVAALRLKGQLDALGVSVDGEHPLFVYIPCGVGGGPGGIAFGLKLVYGDDAHVFFVEPVQAPCMALGMASGKHNAICVQDIGLSGKTHADGLAVGRASGFVGKMMEGLLSGEFTVRDALLYEYMRDLYGSEGLFAEPSACAAFAGPAGMAKYPEMKEYLGRHGLEDRMKNAVHIAWATGGRLVPDDVRREYMELSLEA